MVAQQSTQDVLKNKGSGGVEDDSISASSPQKGLDFSPYIRTILRNIPLILGITLLAAVPAVLSGSKASRTYQGGFRILVEPVTSQARSTDPSSISRAQLTDTNSVDYPTLLQVLQSPELLSKAAQQVQSRYPDVTADMLMGEIFSKNLVVQRVGGTDYYSAARLIDVSYKGRDAQRVQLILEELAKSYLKYSLDDRRSRIGGGVDFIEDQLPALQQRVNSLEADIQSFKQRYRLTEPTTEGADLSKQIQEIQAQRLSTQQQLVEQRSLYARLQQQLGLTPDEAMIAASLSENPRYQELITEIKKLETVIASKSARYNEESPVVRSLLEQRKNLTQLFQDETKKNLGKRLTPGAVNPQILVTQNPLRLELIRQLVTTANTAQLLQVRSQVIAQNSAYLDKRLQQFPTIVRQYNDLQQQLEISTKTLNQFLTQRETLRIEAAQKEVPWEVIAPAKVLTDANGNPVASPSDMSKKLMMQLGIGVALGLAAAFAREKISNVFYSSEDVQSAVQAPLLGVIPFSSEPSVGTIATNEPFLKAFETLYTNLRFLTGSPLRALTIASAGSGDGKSTIALNLAMAAAEMGQSVLLVDANLRLPQLHTQLNLPNQHGISDVLANEKLAWQDAIASPKKNLSVLTAGQTARDSAKLLASARMQMLMEQLQAAFDLIIYDTPNLDEFADASFLAAHTNGIFMVVSLRKAKHPAVKKAVVELKNYRLPILGAISNQVTGKRTSTVSKQDPYGHLKDKQPSRLEGLNILQTPSSTATAEPSSSDAIG
ncbi:polysaccharide biosynthesis tyrosine autokinase [Leptolyngbya sp. FACHB-36]|uniref:GumC family protein n=1 Tax=Leptolyngbya sp. FACHB-36 TaxID=2692808 RepID=UPI00168143BB|nr:tyrosine-protein kinase domain-containing protein [Leptolyngbya sp. FACHB-36]MBD2022171.1 polysaccharide biosynthesis tyrosine autokinase [Leptolyngbya sp. FACHB-36]